MFYSSYILFGLFNGDINCSLNVALNSKIFGE